MKKKVAVIEDEHPIAEMYRFKLEQRGYEVQCAFNGRDGLALVEDFRPELIMLDLRMPEMPGDEMLEKIRSTDWGSSIKVIVLTNISKDEAPPDLRFMHVDRYVVKAHLTPTQVANVVDEILNRPAKGSKAG
jgi:DNA-binding response OmpR family regulator